MNVNHSADKDRQPLMLTFTLTLMGNLELSFNLMSMFWSVGGSWRGLCMHKKYMKTSHTKASLSLPGGSNL